jgi:NAD(P)-dependent dehydrogenase (short-subunit alcohol dehydrogenase family)
LGQPEDIAEMVLSLHSLPWVTGQIVDCDGGLSLFSPIDTFGEAMRE